MSTTTVRMTDGNISSRLVKFAVPLLWGNLFQQLYGVIDAIIVGNFLGPNDLAAVSATGSLMFLIVGFFVGLSSGVSVVISKFFGAKDEYNLKRAIGTSITLSLIISVALTVTTPFLMPFALELMDTPVEIFSGANTYLQTYFLGISTLVLYNTASGIFQAVGDSKRPLRYLLISSIINIVLDILFVTVVQWGIRGVALATVISQAISTILAFRYLNRIQDTHRVTFSLLCFDKPILKNMMSAGIPSAIQNSVASIANVVVQSNVNSFGAVAVAGVGAYVKIEKFAFIPVNAFSASITTFVSQNMGAKEMERVKEGSKKGLIYAVVFTQIIGVLIYFLAPTLIRMFTSDPDVIAMGVLKSRITSNLYFLMAITHSVAAVLRGMGRAKVPMYTLIVCWCVIRIAYIEVVTYFFNDIAMTFWAHPFTWGLSAVFLAIYYKKLMSHLGI